MLLTIADAQSVEVPFVNVNVSTVKDPEQLFEIVRISKPQWNIKEINCTVRLYDSVH